VSPNEIKLLGIVEAQGRVSPRKAGALMGVSTAYAAYLLEYLRQGEYLGTEMRGIYILLPKGVDALISQLVEIESRVQSEIERLTREGERLAKEIKRLTSHKESLKVPASWPNLVKAESSGR